MVNLGSLVAGYILFVRRTLIRRLLVPSMALASSRPALPFRRRSKRPQVALSFPEGEGKSWLRKKANQGMHSTPSTHILHKVLRDDRVTAFRSSRFLDGT